VRVFTEPSHLVSGTNGQRLRGLPSDRLLPSLRAASLYLILFRRRAHGSPPHLLELFFYRPLTGDKHLPTKPTRILRLIFMRIAYRACERQIADRANGENIVSASLLLLPPSPPSLSLSLSLCLSLSLSLSFFRAFWLRAEAREDAATSRGRRDADAGWCSHRFT
jgi:hypothetical protein